jgi:squalene synthase HpnC
VTDPLIAHQSTDLDPSALYIVSEAPYAEQKSWTLAESYAYCQWINRNHYENFPVGSILIPRRLRKHVAAVYAFARTADDFADEAEFARQRMALLNNWLQATTDISTKEVDHPVFIALSDTIERFNIPIQLFKDLIFAFKMDVDKKTYADFDEVLFYCQHSANPVGRIILNLFGYTDEETMQLSDHICTALQLANFWQDVAVDLEKPRIYLPQDEIEKFNYSEILLSQKVFNSAYADLMKFQVDRTQQLFDQGKALIPKLAGRLKYEIKFTWLGGVCILKKIQALNYNTIANRPVVSKMDWFGLGLKGLLGKFQ